MRKRGEIRLLSKNLSTTLLTSNLTMCVYTTAQGAGGDTSLRRELQAVSGVCDENAVHSYNCEQPRHLSFKNI